MVFAIWAMFIFLATFTGCLMVVTGMIFYFEGLSFAGLLFGSMMGGLSVSLLLLTIAWWDLEVRYV